MADEHAHDDRIIAKTQLQPTQIDVDKQLLRDEDLLNEEHLRRMDQVLLRRNLDHARMFSRKLSLELQQYVHLYTPDANELTASVAKTKKFSAPCAMSLSCGPYADSDNVVLPVARSELLRKRSNLALCTTVDVEREQRPIRAVAT